MFLSPILRLSISFRKKSGENIAVKRIYVYCPFWCDPPADEVSNGPAELHVVDEAAPVVALVQFQDATVQVTNFLIWKRIFFYLLTDANLPCSFRAPDLSEASSFR